MKKILCSLLIVLSTAAFSQETPKEESKSDLNVISLELSVGVGANIGVVFEEKNSTIFGKKGEDLNESNITKIYYSSVTLTSSSGFIRDVDGSGFGIEYGERFYLGKKKHQGFHLSYFLMYGRYAFDEGNISTFGGESIPFKGKYEYFSFFSPEVGYKVLIGKNFALNLHAGAAWLIETKAQGDVDNQSFDNWAVKLGLGLGYSF
jgi:hypothetical protein